MKVVKPTTVTTAMLVSSTVAEDDYAEWNAATSYAVGDKVIRLTTHRIYEALQAGIDATLPENATGGPTPRWLDLGATNRWKMFDEIVGSQTTGPSPMVIELQTGIINSVAMVGLSGINTVRVQMINDAVTVYDQTIDLDNTPIYDWYDYFFEPYDTSDSALFRNLPPFGNATVTATFTSTGTPAVGGLIVGNAYSLGDVSYGATAGITDYSRKETDTFGLVTIVRRAYSKRMSVKLFFDTAGLRRLHTLLADLRATPCVWIGAEKDTVTFAPLVIYGFYRDFSIDIAYPTLSYCNLEIEGLT